MNINLEEIDLGRFDAESDDKLIQYFIETKSVSSIVRGKQLVLGRKGTGKTALFIHLKNTLPHTTVDLELNDYLFTAHKKLREAGVAENSSYFTAWKTIIYISIIGSIQHKISSSEKRSLNHY